MKAGFCRSTMPGSTKDTSKTATSELAELGPAGAEGLRTADEELPDDEGASLPSLGPWPGELTRIKGMTSSRSNSMQFDKTPDAKGCWPPCAR